MAVDDAAAAVAADGATGRLRAGRRRRAQRRAADEEVEEEPWVVGEEATRLHEAALARLLDAIEMRDGTMLRAALKSAESDRRRGVFACDGNGWPGDEVKAAREVLAAVEQKAWVKAEQAKLDAIVAERQSRQQERLAACTMREDALGSDSYGRRYWYLLCEPSRLWVEESTRRSGGGRAAMELLRPRRRRRGPLASRRDGRPRPRRGGAEGCCESGCRSFV